MFGDYDKTLWLMLAGDIGCRERIASFVRDIPDGCFEQVRQMIDVYKSTGESQNLRVDKMLDDNVTNLSFSATVYEDGDLSLSINKYFADDIFTDVSFFSIKLCPFDTIYNRFDLFPLGKRDVGEISYLNSSRIANSENGIDEFSYYVGKEKKFSTFSSPFGFFVEVDTESHNLQDDELKNKNSKKIVSVRKMPDKLVPFNFRDLKSVNRLVRSRNPRKNKRSK